MEGEGRKGEFGVIGQATILRCVPNEVYTDRHSHKHTHTWNFTHQLRWLFGPQHAKVLVCIIDNMWQGRVRGDLGTCFCKFTSGFVSWFVRNIKELCVCVWSYIKCKWWGQTSHILRGLFPCNPSVDASTKKHKQQRKDKTRKEIKRKKNQTDLQIKRSHREHHLAALWIPSLPLHRKCKCTTCNELIRVQPWSGLLRETVFSQAEPLLHCHLSST